MREIEPKEKLKTKEDKPKYSKLKKTGVVIGSVLLLNFTGNLAYGSFYIGSKVNRIIGELYNGNTFGQGLYPRQKSLEISLALVEQNLSGLNDACKSDSCQSYNRVMRYTVLKEMGNLNEKIMPKQRLLIGLEEEQARAYHRALFYGYFK
ncbi:hypothetical protein HYX19_04565 [Candidatus Woesearchaeota archaeon]|nr:hypothetical protein [Candidatus Woesearchaeota archaeon]